MDLRTGIRIRVVPADAPSEITYSQSREEYWMGLFTSAAPYVVLRLLHVGGYSNTNSSNALNYGLSYVNGNNSLSNYNKTSSRDWTSVISDLQTDIM